MTLPNRWCLNGLGDLLVLQPHLELIEAFRAGTELVTPKSGQLVLELLDEKVTIIELALEHTDRALEGVDVIGQVAGLMARWCSHRPFYSGSDSRREHGVSSHLQ